MQGHATMYQAHLSDVLRPLAQALSRAEGTARQTETRSLALLQQKSDAGVGALEARHLRSTTASSHNVQSAPALPMMSKMFINNRKS